MNTNEIRKRLQDGTMTPDQARQAFQAIRQQHEGVSQARTEVVPSRPPTRNLPSAGKLNIADVQARDRKQLAAVRSDLALEIEKRSTRHEYQRQYVEESMRHAVSLPAVAMLGLADGAIEGIGYSLSEIVESISYTATRTLRRFKEGIERGIHQ